MKSKRPTGFMKKRWPHEFTALGGMGNPIARVLSSCELTPDDHGGFSGTPCCRRELVQKGRVEQAFVLH